MAINYQWSKSELAYLERVGLNKKDLFDASLLKPKQYKLLMKLSGSEIAYGVNHARHTVIDSELVQDTV